MFLETYVVVASSAFGSAATLTGVATLAGITTLVGTSSLRSTSALVGVIFVVILPGVVLVGRAPEQVVEFIDAEVKPILEKYKDELGISVEINV